MGVGVDKTGHDGFSGAVHNLVAVCGSLKVTDASDAIFFNEDISLAVNLTAVVHGKNHGIFQKNFHKSGSSLVTVFRKGPGLSVSFEIVFSISENFAIVTCEI